MWIALVFIIVSLICLIFLGREDKVKTINCKYCGHEFEYSESKAVEYKLSGKLQKAQECPKCGKYTEIQ